MIAFVKESWPELDEDSSFWRSEIFVLAEHTIPPDRRVRRAPDDRA